jgi:lysophospholipase L1-like esterase
MMGSGALPFAQRRAVYPGPRIMFLGDSITHGNGSDATGGYRGPLCQLMPGLRPIGTSILNPIDAIVGPGYDQQEGHPGFTSINITAGIASYIATVGAPDVVLYHIGANDDFGFFPTQVADNMAATFAILQAANPNVLMLMGCPQVPPYTTDNTRYPYWLSGIPTLAARIASIPGIIQCPVGAKFVDADLSDGIHPVYSGYVKMAAAWALNLCALGLSL